MNVNKHSKKGMKPSKNQASIPGLGSGKRLSIANAVALLVLCLVGVSSPVRADQLDNPTDGFGLDLSIGGQLGEGHRSPPVDRPQAGSTEPDASTADATPAPTMTEPRAQHPKIRLYGSDDRGFGVEILDRQGQPERRLRIGIPFTQFN
jgi:hypothetical protein